MINVNPIMYKKTKRNPTPGATEFVADIEPGKSIKITKVKGYNAGKSTSFNLGDVASYGSYNLIYTGTIVAITQNSVSIKEKYSSRVHRHSLDKFAYRNYDFDIERVNKHNNEISMMI